MKIKISVIIPVYQGEAYIGRTIDLLKKQTFEEFEAFFVDNNSSDGTVAAMERAIGGDERFTILQEKKEGPSAARNRAINQVKGEWVAFLDSDDIFAENYLESLYNGTKNCNQKTQKILMVVSGYETFENGEKIYSSPDEEIYYSIDQMILRLFQVEHYQGFIWNKLFDRRVIQNGRLCFDENIFFNEDRLFVLNYLLECKNRAMKSEEYNFKIHKITCRPYFYQIRPQSSMGSVSEKKRLSEKEITEIDAFGLMISKLRQIYSKDSRVLQLVQKDMVYSELRLFKKMIWDKNIFKYRHHKMRKYAKQARVMEVEFELEKERILQKIFLRYGRIGVIYTRNPDFFCDVF